MVKDDIVSAHQCGIVIQTMITQAILGVRCDQYEVKGGLLNSYLELYRAFNLSRRSRVVGWFLITVYSVACVVSIPLLL